MPGPDGSEVDCCGADWAAIYANRVRQMMNTYRQNGAARVYWLTLPTPRDGRPPADRPGRQRRDRRRRRAVAPIRSASSTRCRSSRPVTATATRCRSTGSQTIVRQSDGIHLNDAGSASLAGVVLAAIDQDFTRLSSRTAAFSG